MKRGDTFPHPSDGGEVRVMAVADGYAMCRRPGCAPFVVAVSDIKRPGWMAAGEKIGEAIRRRGMSRNIR